jgi:hypothetical protein
MYDLDFSVCVCVCVCVRATRYVCARRARMCVCVCISAQARTHVTSRNVFTQTVLHGEKIIRIDSSDI